MFRIQKPFFIFCLVLGICAYISGSYGERIIHLTTLPQPAPGSYFITSAPLEDGTYIVWNGDDIYKQVSMNTDEFVKIAEGYQGDPAFIAVSPNGEIAILGQGYLGNLYRLDLQNPQDFDPSCIVGNLSHFYGAFLNENLLILDVGKPDFSGSEIHVLSISGGKSISKPVLSRIFMKPKEMIIDKPPYAYSASVAVDISRGWVYIMDGNARELRKFSIEDIINAYNSNETLNWEDDGILIGTAGRYFSGGVSGITNDGLLIIGGSEGFMMPGGIQEVNPLTGEILKVWDPAGNQGYYSAFYNIVGDSILGIVSNQGYLILRSYEECPDCLFVRKSIYEAGTDICLDVFGMEIPANPTFRWSKVGENIELNPRISGINCKKLFIYNSQPEDSGTYICEIGNAKAIYRITIKVTDKNVPASNYFGILIGVFFIIFTGIVLLHKKVRVAP
ncbi:MAG: hypothetical protein N3G21_09350 [Candidatus Hydrogenedentes bacterium]|nr:hypothetical protein [Candidatus Hydrogenedentota bacterium]